MKMDGEGEMYRFLNYLSLDITHACNLNCSFCSKRISARNGKHMTADQLEDVLKFVTGYKTMHVSGGDPLVHPFFNSMMRTILEKFNHVVVTTNGLALNRVYEDVYNKLNF